MRSRSCVGGFMASRKRPPISSAATVSSHASAERYRNFAACLALAASVALLYRKALRLWWTYDDPFHLHLCSTFSSGAMLFDRSFWSHLPNKVFTPLLFLSLK